MKVIYGKVLLQCILAYDKGGDKVGNVDKSHKALRRAVKRRPPPVFQSGGIGCKGADSQGGTKLSERKATDLLAKCRKVRRKDGDIVKQMMLLTSIGTKGKDLVPDGVVMFNG